MKSKRFLIAIEFLGFRFHGVQSQSDYPSIQGRVNECLKKAFHSQKFNTRFASRTDAMVSALDTYFVLMFDEAIDLSIVNESLSYLPPDIKQRGVQVVSDDFIILNAVDHKTYRYYFSFNTYAHPFSAPFMTVLSEELDIELMMKACDLFIGTHDFSNYCYKPKEGTQFIRTISCAKITTNNELTASFFPQESWYFEVSSTGFMRGQVRLMMGALFRLGKNEISLNELSESLIKLNPQFVKWMAPPTGLILHQTKLVLPDL